MGNLAIRSYGIQVPREGRPGRFDFPGRKKMIWDGANMKLPISMRPISL